MIPTRPSPAMARDMTPEYVPRGYRGEYPGNRPPPPLPEWLVEQGERHLRGPLNPFGPSPHPVIQCGCGVDHDPGCPGDTWSWDAIPPAQSEWTR